MARWKVLAPHYIYAEQFGEPTEWVREETNRETGRAFRKTFKVPLLVDPNDAYYMRTPSGMCVVATKGSEHPGDIVFYGPPTPDMEPIDDEAMAISDKERHKWISPIDSVPITMGEDFGALMMQALERQLTDAMRNQTIPQAQSLAGAGSSELAEMKALLAEQQKMINSLMNKDAPVQADAPLEDIDPDTAPAMPPPQVRRPTSGLRPR